MTYGLVRAELSDTKKRVSELTAEVDSLKAEVAKLTAERDALKAQVEQAGKPERRKR
jgi:cell division protein FtsB